MIFSSLFKNSFSSAAERAFETPDARIIDVRTPAEFASGHLPGAENIPLDTIASAKLEGGKKLFVYCHSGARSARAVAYLKSIGADAVDMGGIAGYKGKLIGGK